MDMAKCGRFVGLWEVVEALDDGTYWSEDTEQPPPEYEDGGAFEVGGGD